MQQELKQLKDLLESVGFTVNYLPTEGYDEEHLLVDIDKSCYSFHYEDSWTEEFVNNRKRYDEMYPEAPESLKPPKSFFIYEDGELILNKTSKVEDAFEFFIAYFERLNFNEGSETSGYSHACGYYN